ncbi:hypothetical protein V9K67_25575 [Paraflavisolibacter sp. H34]
MKRIFFLLALAGVITSSLPSCSATKKDCQGVRHHRLKNGVYL